MSRCKKLVPAMLISSILLSMLGQPASAEEITATSIQTEGSAIVASDVLTPLVPQETTKPVHTALPDKLNHIVSSITSATGVHYYSFKAVRGQKLLVAWNEGVAVPPSVQFEYYSNGQWNAKQLVGPLVFSSIKAGQELVVRFSHKQDMPFVPGQKYDIFIGSYPVLKRYELKGEPGVLKIPSGYSDLSWNAVQAYTDVTMEGFFTDTKDFPLEGAVARLKVELDQSRIPLINHDATSDSTGKILALVTMGRCAGGYEARDFTHYDHGSNTWRSYYYEGSWLIYNKLLGRESLLEAYADKGNIGHICKHRLIQSIRARN